MQPTSVILPTASSSAATQQEEGPLNLKATKEFKREDSAHQRSSKEEILNVVTRRVKKKD